MLALQEVDLPAILLRWRSYRKVEPDYTFRAMLEQEFIKVLLRLVGIVEEDTRIANQLLLPRYSDIDSTPRQMIRGRHSPNLPIQLRRPIPARNNDRSSSGSGLEITSGSGLEIKFSPKTSTFGT